MKKAIFLIITIVFSIVANAQKKDKELMYMVLENFRYQPNTSKFKFDLVIKNNSDKTLYFIKPKNYFFGNHNDKENKSSEYGRYYSKPYYASITPYKNCSSIETVKDAAMDIEETVEVTEDVLEGPADAVKDYKLEKEETIIESTETETAVEAVVDGTESVYNSYKAFKIIDEVIEIPAKEYRKFKNIEIDRNYGVFCKNVKYKITVDYYSSINPFDYYTIKTYKKHLRDNNAEEINALFENEFKILKKENSSNTENLKNILKSYDGLQKTNTTKFYSNTIENN